jgi:hypothetical protein
VLAAVSNVVFGAGHVVFQVAKRHFWLNHPKFSQVTGSVGVFGAESGSKSVDIGQGAGVVLAVELTADRQVCRAAKEVGFVVDFAIRAAGQAASSAGAAEKEIKILAKERKERCRESLVVRVREDAQSRRKKSERPSHSLH